MNFEAIDSHLAAHSTQLATERSTLEARAKSVNLCLCYRAVRPILEAVSVTPFIPKHWREAVQTFIGAMDLVCPSAKDPAPDGPVS